MANRIKIILLKFISNPFVTVIKIIYLISPTFRILSAKSWKADAMYKLEHNKNESTVGVTNAIANPAKIVNK